MAHAAKSIHTAIASCDQRQSFQVGVMAEIIGQVQLGIGRQLNIARFNMDMTAIFAWTLWIILLLLILEWIRKYSMDKLKK